MHPSAPGAAPAAALFATERRPTLRRPCTRSARSLRGGGRRLPRAGFLPGLGLLILGACGDGGGSSPTEPDPDPGNPPAPANRLPTAAFTASTGQGIAPVTITFDASASSDSDGTLASFLWAFGDGGTSSGRTTSHVYASGGRFEVALTVVDDRGGRDSTTAEILVSSPVGTGPNTVAGRVWFDRDLDGVQGADEPGLPRFVVFLDEDGDGELDLSEPLAFTDPEGDWAFAGLEDRPYTVSQAMPFGWTNTTPGPAPDPSPPGPRRIVGGDFAEIGDYPFQVALMQGSFQFCGGTLVNSQWVLTAAHCVEGAIGGQFDILIGTDDVTSGGERVGVTAVRSHPEYDNVIDYDVSMLRLERPLLFPRSFLQTPDRPELSEPGVVATAIGWGRLGNGSDPDELRSVQVPIITNEACADISGPGVIGPRSLCAGGPGLGRGVCYGDSGGPLLTPFEFGWTQVGVTSFLAERNSCGEEPAVYARVSEMLDFIVGTAGIESSGSFVVDWSEGAVRTVDFGNFH